MREAGSLAAYPRCAFGRVDEGAVSDAQAIAARRRSAVGLVLAAAGFALLVLPSLYPLEGAARAVLALCCIALGLVVNIAALLNAGSDECLLAGVGLSLGALSLLWVVARLYGLGARGLLIIVLVLLADAGIGFWCMTVFRRKGRSAAGGFALGFLLTFVFTVLGAVAAMLIAYLSRPGTDAGRPVAPRLAENQTRMGGDGRA